jgi:hypothetical protein
VLVRRVVDDWLQQLCGRRQPNFESNKFQIIRFCQNNKAKI